MLYALNPNDEWLRLPLNFSNYILFMEPDLLRGVETSIIHVVVITFGQNVLVVKVPL